MNILHCQIVGAVFLASCAHVAPGAAVPETISLKGGSTFTHEPGEAVKQVNTALVEVLWRLKK